MLFLTRRETFNAAHRLYNPKWSDEKNLEVFGGCSNPNWHGHNYTLWVTVRGEMQNNENGLLINIKILSQLIKRVIVDKLDHRNLNLEVDFLKNKLASTENLAIAIWEQLEQPVEELGIELHCVKVMETENNYVEYFGSKL
jgi:6-pyruvoyltetrahydropterin/6-carboxytetrahydropterin synthase